MELAWSCSPVANLSVRRKKTLQTLASAKQSTDCVDLPLGQTNMAKLYALATNGLSSLNQPAPPSARSAPSESSAAQIKCSDCGHQVPLLSLGSHICRSNTPSSTPRQRQQSHEPQIENGLEQDRGLGIDAGLPRKWNFKAAGLRINTAASKFKGQPCCVSS